MISLTDKETKFYESQKVCHICKKEVSLDKNDKNYYKVRGRCHYTGKFRGLPYLICNFKYNTPKKIPIVFHNGSTYGYHFIIKELSEEFKGQFGCLGENSETYIIFSVLTKKELDNGKTITYKLKFNGSLRFLSISLSKLVDKLFEIYSKVCKEYKLVCNFIEFENNKLNYKCKECNKRSSKLINGLIKKFVRMDQFCNGDINKLILFLRKGVYPYKYMNSWERFNETSVLNKEAFNSKFVSEDCTDEDYKNYQKVRKRTLNHLAKLTK